MSDDCFSLLKIPAHINFLSVAMLFIEENCNVFNLDKEDMLKLRLAAEEAIKNVIEHGYENDVHEHFTVMISDKGDRVEIVIKEKGKPYDPDFEKQEKNAKGYGLLLIKNAMDETYFKNLGRDGKETYLLKYKSSGKISGDSDYTKTKADKPKEINYRLRAFEEKDAPAISRCAYESYGYSYESFIYYPSQLVRLNREGKLVSYVAELEGNRIIGHIAYKFNNGFSCAELGVAFVNPRYRGHGLLTHLTKFAIDSVFDTSQVMAMYVNAVTAHPRSQKTIYKFDFVPSAFLFGVFPDDVNFKNIDTSLRTKIPSIVISKVVRKNETRVVFPPEKHRAIVSKILSDLQADFRISTGRDRLPEQGQGTFKYVKNELLNIVDVFIRSFGRDTIGQIRGILRKFLAAKVDAVFLHLNLEDPFVSLVSDRCEDMGFIFAGILPFGADGCHDLILQYVNIEIAFDGIRLSGDKAFELFDYVKAFTEV